MKIVARNTAWMGMGCTLALLVGAPALADDTELLLLGPDPSNRPKANVMFILDTSGSMSDLQTTRAPYDGNTVYGGACDTNALYWTDIDILPTCDVTNEQWIDKTAFYCDFASNQIFGIGTFTNTMIQYRADDAVLIDGSLVASTTERWQYLQPGNHTGPVECQADSGTHGDGDVNRLWAGAGANLSNPWTNKREDEVGWGSAPRNLSYTVYDGNYINWKNSATTVSLSRNAIMREVTKKVLNSVNNMNVGIMRFNPDAGGRVIQAMTDLDTNRADILAAVDSLPASGRTPLAESLYESARYWLGTTADYGVAQLAATDPDALSSTNPMTYKQPELAACAKNYNVLLTDGVPNTDLDGPVKAPTLRDWTATTGSATCITTKDTYFAADASIAAGEGRCLVETAEYLGKIDTDLGTDGTQSVTTHTIGFTVDLPILRDTALAGGGQYFVADDVESLTIALLRIVGEINDRSQSFSAPAVTVNTFNRTQNLNDLYLTMFGARAKTHWPGNLKKYSIDDGVIVDADGLAAVDPLTGFFYETSRSIWTVGADDGNNVALGGAARQLPVPAGRRLFTNNGFDSNLAGASNAISVGNLLAYNANDFGLTGAAGEPTLDQLVRWMLGEDVRDEDGNAATTVRYAMGDPLHSRPAAIVYGGTPTAPDTVVYTATNDGYVHAISGATGTELWSFVPRELLPNMTRLFFDPSAKYKQYGVDGNIVPVVADRDNDGIIEPGDGDFVYVIFGMRRGGMTYYALDVTDKNAPELLWTRTLASAGESWSTPAVARMDINAGGLNSDKAVLVIGGGYDTVHDTAAHPAVADASGAGIHILDLVSGQTIWRGGRDIAATKVFSGMTRAFPNQVRVVDMNGDRFADRMYAVDVSGQVWRFDVKRGETPANLVNGGVIARLGAEGLGSPTAADTRRFYNAPDLSIFRDPVQGQRFIAISIGSGYRAHPFDLTATDRFYSLRDPAVFNQLDQTSYDNYVPITEADLVEVSGSVKAVVGASARGWMFTLPANEKVLADSVTFNDEIFFVSFTPDTMSQSSCSAGRGTNFLYRVSVVNGDPVVNNLDAIASGDEDAARREQLAQGGIAPSPTFLFPSPTDPNCTGAACAPPPIGCVGVECFDPGYANFPVRTLWTQDGIE
ncbi:MAG: PilC/PilY family type IV pilus protein [Gammaproteobacteria bacterium]|nr:PilC/PilY family type IV pilus protein [Gammaproteobacteria bacterium]MDH5310140.1 PilC/PilY family type IV pilus protein [Gammaproteobacteria bacterium]